MKEIFCGFSTRNGNVYTEELYGFSLYGTVNDVTPRVYSFSLINIENSEPHV